MPACLAPRNHLLKRAQGHAFAVGIQEHFWLLGFRIKLRSVAPLPHLKRILAITADWDEPLLVAFPEHFEEALVRVGIRQR